MTCCRVLAAVAAMAPLAAPQAPDFEPLNLKPGLWEIRLTVRSAGAPPLSPEAMARLTPEQAARVRAQNGARREQTTVKQSCLDASELREPLGLQFGNPQECKQTVVTATAVLQEIKVDCGMGLNRGGGKVRITAASPENARVTSEFYGTDSARTATLSSTATLKWLGADCAAKPAAGGGAAESYKLGRAQLEAGQFEAAVSSFDQVLRSEPGNALAFNARGYAYLRLGKYPQAIADFTAAIAHRPNYRLAYQNRAIARRKTGDAAAAAQDERKAAELSIP